MVEDRGRGMVRLEVRSYMRKEIGRGRSLGFFVPDPMLSSS